MDKTLAVMTIGATYGMTFALQHMGMSEGGLGGRIITTASTAGLTVSKDHFGLTCGVDGGGYAVSKHVNVALTQMFPHLTPKPSEDGVKAYALCPSGVPTRMILGDIKQTKLEDGRRLTLQEVGNALMHSLQKDIDGACYFIYPDLPIIEVPDKSVIQMHILIIVGKIATALGIKYLSKIKVNIILMFLLYLGFVFLHQTFKALLSIIL